MILNASGRTDIVAFYTEWFMNRYKEGFVDVRNPFNPKLVSRIYFEDVDAIVFCTKNPIPIVHHLKEIKKPILLQVTLTPYRHDIEPNVPSKGDIIEAVKQISKILGADYISVRYDPIFINESYTLEYHLKAFSKLCSLLDGSINKIIVSFLDDYKNVRKNKYFLNHKQLTEEDYKIIGVGFSEIASKHNMTVQTCFEERNLSEYGFIVDECISHQMAYMITGKKFRNWVARKCNCVETVDIGHYNCCKHFCKYCYANYDEKAVNDSYSKHNPHSSLLIGELEEDDVIKVRKR